MHRPSAALLAASALLATAALTGCTYASRQPTAAATSGPTETTGVDLSTLKPGAAAALVPAAAKTKGTLTVATSATFPPFEFIGQDGHTIVGFDADMAAGIAAKMGLKVSMINTGFETILVGIDSGKQDMAMSGLAITPERGKVVDFVAYLFGGTGLGVPKGNPQQLSMDPMTLCGHSVGAPKGSLQGIEFLPKFSDECVANGKKPINVLLYPSQNEANLAVVSGRSDAVMAPATPMNYEFRRSNIAMELAPGKPYKPVQVGIAMANESPLAPAVSKAVQELVADGTMQQLMHTWDIPETALDPDAGEIIR
ncbi:ABC transporter substrate-binding protein [Intrasporangium sp.]|uniref:ABC transporter substrate-binding protein n=1 Tax=Intrasporangium sp. TaxID=1925024 RepID=UPI0032215851